MDSVYLNFKRMVKKTSEPRKNSVCRSEPDWKLFSPICREILCAYGVGEVKGVMDELGFSLQVYSNTACPEEETRRKLDTYFEQAHAKGVLCGRADLPESG